MKITILTVGTRGDVQPFVALGLGLKAAGYDVTVATNTSFESFVREHGLRYAPLNADFMELLQTAEGRKALEAGRGSLGMLRTVMPMLRRVLDDSWEAAQESDAIVYHPKALSGYHIAEKLGAEEVLATVSPENAFSLRNIISEGFEVVSEKNMYGGYRRYIVRKKIRPH